MNLTDSILPHYSIEITPNWGIELVSAVFLFGLLGIGIYGAYIQDKTLNVRAENNQLLKKIDQKIDLLFTK